jgi:hypothetical protein
MTADSPAQLAMRRALDAFRARVTIELPDEMTVRRLPPGGDDPTGGGEAAEWQTVQENVPVLVELGAPGVSTTAEQLEEGVLVTLRCPAGQAPRAGDTVLVTASGGVTIDEPAPIRVVGVSMPRSYETLRLVTGRQVRG